MNYIILYSPSLSNDIQARWVIVNTKTGEVVDNAGGYGYKTPEGARKCLNYKLSTGMPFDYKKECKEMKSL